MDNSNGRPTSAAMEQQQQQQQQQRAGNNNNNNTLGPRSRSAYSLEAVSPGAVVDSSSDYFDGSSNLRQQPSRQSVRSNSRLSGDVPFGESRPGSRSSNRRPSIRIRRVSNASLNLQDIDAAPSGAAAGPSSSHNSPAIGGVPSSASSSSSHYGRPRSVSQPMMDVAGRDGDASARHSRRAQQIALPRLTEEGSRPTMQELGIVGSALSPTASLPGSIAGPHHEPLDVDPNFAQQNRRGRFSRMFWPGASAGGSRRSQDTMSRGSLQQDDEYDEHLVDLLDTIDPEIQTLSTLTNIQNSLFVPDLGGLINRRPTYTLTQHDIERVMSRPGTSEPRTSGVPQEPATSGVVPDDRIDEAPSDEEHDTPPIRRTDTITSRLSDSHFAALPHGVSLAHWTDQEKWELDDHVRHMLHSRRSKFKRMMKGFGQYVRQPLGFLVTLYAVCITAFGLAWVLFLIGWIYVGDKEKQKYTLHIIDSVLVALFAIVGDGMAPFRAVDTYHMIFVTRYSRIMAKGKQRRDALESGEGSDASGVPAIALNGKEPSLGDPVDGTGLGQPADFRPPSPLAKDQEIGLAEDEDEDLYPLTPKQQKRFLHHRKKLAQSHSFYKPHETFTHYKFPLSFLVTVVLLLDLHSCLQISLGATTWGIDYHHRNAAITTTILCVSITTNIVAGLVILKGDKKTRKKDVVNLIDRQELTSDAMKKLASKKKKRGVEKEGEDTPHVLTK